MNANNVRRLMEIIYKNVKTKKGKRYFGHLERVAEQATKFFELKKGGWSFSISPTIEMVYQVAYLHDVIEDGLLTDDDLYWLGIDKKVIRLVRNLNKHNYDSWDSYIVKVSEDLITLCVKLADLDHNSKLSRIPPNSSFEEIKAKHEKYLYAYMKLKKAYDEF